MDDLDATSDDLRQFYPSGYRPKSAKGKKLRKKSARRRAVSDAPDIIPSQLMPISVNGLNNIRIKKKHKKSKKYQSQTPVIKSNGSYNFENNHDPFGVNKKLKKKNKLKIKKSSMTPKVSLSTSVEGPIFYSFLRK